MFYNNRKLHTNSITERNRKIQEIYKDEMNNECFDCGKSNPDFISANNGVFICKDCMAIHYQFSDEVSLIIKNNLFLLNEEQINYIYYGGNRKLLEFINYEFPQLQNYQPEILYKTQAMQYYRDKLYYLVEGGNKPMKPNEHFAYKLISNFGNFPMTEKREKYTINNFGNSNNKNANNVMQTEFDNYYIDEENENENINEDINNDNDNDVNSNLNINNYYNSHNNNFNINNNKMIVDISNNASNNSSFVYTKNKMNRNNSFITSKMGDRNLTNFQNKKIKIREPQNINFLSNNNSKSNFYQKRDNFFKEMNRLFGGSAFDDEENEYEQQGNMHNRNINNTMVNNTDTNFNKENNRKNPNYDVQRTYQVQKTKPSYNYNNFIKNTININNNNTNIYFDEEGEMLNKNNILSKSQLLNNENDNNNFTFGRANNINNNINNNNIYNKYNQSKTAKPSYKNKVKKKINMNIQKKIYIKPKVMISFNNNNDSRSPSITGTDNNYNSVPIDEFSKTRSQHININSDVNDKDDSGKKDNIFYNTLSPTLLSPISNNSGQNPVFYKKNVGYSKKIIIKDKNKENNNNNDKNDNIDNNYELGDRAVTPIQKNKYVKKMLIVDNNNIDKGNNNEGDNEKVEEEEEKKNNEIKEDNKEDIKQNINVNDNDIDNDNDKNVNDVKYDGNNEIKNEENQNEENKYESEKKKIDNYDYDNKDMEIEQMKK